MLKDIKEVEKACKEIREYQSMIDEMTTLMESMKSEIKEYMGSNTELIAGEYKIRYTPVSSNRFDQSKFKEDHPDIYDIYTRLSESRRFSIN